MSANLLQVAEKKLLSCKFDEISGNLPVGLPMFLVLNKIKHKCKFYQIYFQSMVGT